VLSEWERERCIIPERSYKYVPDKGNFRMDHYARLFGPAPKDQVSENYLKYLSKFEKKFTEYVLRPTKYGRIKENETLDRLIQNSKKESWRSNNTAQSIYFGFPDYKPNETNPKISSKTLPKINKI
jgi:hypothetical protein